jgi:hypothetical protein
MTVVALAPPQRIERSLVQCDKKKKKKKKRRGEGSRRER